MSDVDAARERLIEAIVNVNPGGSAGYERGYLDALLAPAVRADLHKLLGLVGENPYGTDIPGDWAERELHKGWAEGFAAGRATSEGVVRGAARNHADRLTEALTAIQSHGALDDNALSMIWTARVAMNPDALDAAPHHLRGAIGARFAQRA